MIESNILKIVENNFVVTYDSINCLLKIWYWQPSYDIGSSPDIKMSISLDGVLSLSKVLFKLSEN